MGHLQAELERGLLLIQQKSLEAGAMRQAAHQHTDDEKPFGEYQQVGERHEIFFAVPHLTRKTFAVYQQVDEYDRADDIE